ncbi:2-keto-3-deoxygluconate permease [Allofournierella sp.]|uniref:2-keto-3-deoxygluconate permease n=1 Tax=Allofournierella sp. TaxID=1940256 RepID=UPI003AB6973C
MKKIKFKRFPGDTIVVPMLIGVVLNSFVPQVLQIGGFFTGIVNGTSALVGVFLLFLGATIDVRSTPKAIKIGAVVIGTKVALSVLLGLGVAFLCNDNFLGLSSLAVISAVSVANNALYSGIVAQYDDDAVKGAVAITSLSVGPTVTMIALSSAGLASISVWSIVGSILPLIIGIALGNLSAWFKKTLSAGVTPSIIVVGFALGCGMSIQQLFQGGLSGILLGLVTVFVVGGITVLADKLTGGSGIAGAAISSTAASGVSNPGALAAVDPAYAAVAPIATAQVAASVLITSFLTPMLTSFVAKQKDRKAAKNGAMAEAE